MELNGAIALITGSGVRLGKAIALALAQAGCNLALHYHSSVDDILQVAELTEANNVRAEIFQADLSNPESLNELCKKVVDTFGYFDILINNAAIYLSGSGAKTNWTMLEDQFRLNLFAPIMLTRLFAEQLPPDRNGKVVNISDAKVNRIQTDHFAYRLTKNAINQMTQMFALELAPHITVNAVAPGVMLPLAGKEDVDLQALAEKRIPLLRVGSPEIVAQNVVHILKQDFMTGNIIRIDGGEAL